MRKTIALLFREGHLVGGGGDDEWKAGDVVWPGVTCPGLLGAGGPQTLLGFLGSLLLAGMKA